MTTSPTGQLHMQVMWNRLISVVEEQAQALLRTAFGSVVREAGDLSAGVYDLRGRMLAQAVTGTPGHVNAMAASVNFFLERYPVPTMAEGDVAQTLREDVTDMGNVPATAQREEGKAYQFFGTDPELLVKKQEAFDYVASTWAKYH